MAAGDLTTLDAVHGWLGLDPSDATDDAQLATLITAASGFIRQYTGRDFSSQTYTEVRDGTGGIRLRLANTPILSVASLTIDGQAIPAGDAFQTRGYYITQALVSLNGYWFCRGAGNVSVTYQAGYTVIPSEVAQACTELVGFRYREASRVGMASKGGAGETTAFVIKDMPPSVLTILKQLKKVVPV